MRANCVINPSEAVVFFVIADSFQGTNRLQINCNVYVVIGINKCLHNRPFKDLM